jgi:hypothetical protein
MRGRVVAAAEKRKAASNGRSRQLTVNGGKGSFSFGVQATVAILVCIGVISLAVDAFFVVTYLNGQRDAPPDKERISLENEDAVLDFLTRKVNLTLSASQIRSLPKQKQIDALYGTDPIVIHHDLSASDGKARDLCQVYRDSVPEANRMLGVAGMFSTGTNLVTRLLKQNCYIPARLQKYGGDTNVTEALKTLSRESLGIRWQVPWGKHVPAHYRSRHLTDKAQTSGVDPSQVLPVITIRNPYRWMQSVRFSFVARELIKLPLMLMTPLHADVQESIHCTMASSHNLSSLGQPGQCWQC